MPKLIKNGQILDDTSVILTDSEGNEVHEDGDAIVPLACWLDERHHLKARHTSVGVLLEGDAEPSELKDDLDYLKLIAINFPSFVDGRGYSIARLLRERYGFKGELRAVGDIQRDQLYYLARCGFDSFVIPDGRDAEAALASFNDFSDSYQATVDRPVPLFRRRK
ncbi:DUF934 domain-containing protein [Leeia oryzae]|uniref:DUF934 domain-containing protein n=1 Tax=Leeia oryzae TaxID=356662 RepID=UPI0003809AFD|nr:DUF934 domain-containing protein [Leeia oryzae]